MPSKKLVPKRESGSSGNSKKENLYDQLFQSLKEYFGGYGQEDHEANLRRALEEDDRFCESLEGLDEEERERRIEEREEKETERR